VSTQHPITPPPELVQQWAKDRALLGDDTQLHIYIATKAAQWGADEELKAVCQLLYADLSVPLTLSDIRAARRPKPPSLKEQALQLLETYNTSGVMLTADQSDTIRRALEALND
jgi:hypothetical protein